MDYIIFIVAAFLGFVIGKNSTSTKLPPKTNEELLSELVIAKNLNESLLKDKHELQEQLWKLTEKV